jgi:hypothetical protein
MQSIFTDLNISSIFFCSFFWSVSNILQPQWSRLVINYNSICEWISSSSRTNAFMMTWRSPSRSGRKKKRDGIEALHLSGSPYPTWRWAMRIGFLMTLEHRWPFVKSSYNWARPAQQMPLGVGASVGTEHVERRGAVVSCQRNCVLT